MRNAYPQCEDNPLRTVKYCLDDGIRQTSSKLSTVGGIRPPAHVSYTPRHTIQSHLWPLNIEQQPLGQSISYSLDEKNAKTKKDKKNLFVSNFESHDFWSWFLGPWSTDLRCHRLSHSVLTENLGFINTYDPTYSYAQIACFRCMDTAHCPLYM